MCLVWDTHNNLCSQVVPPLFFPSIFPPSFFSPPLLLVCSSSSSIDCLWWTSSSHTGRGGADLGQLWEGRLCNRPHVLSWHQPLLKFLISGRWKLQNVCLPLFFNFDLSCQGFLLRGFDVRVWFSSHVKCDSSARCWSRRPCFKNHLKWFTLSNNADLDPLTSLRHKETILTRTNSEFLASVAAWPPG